MNFNDEEKAREELDRALISRDPDSIARAAMANIWPLYSAHAEALLHAIALLPGSTLEKFPALRLIHPITPVLARTLKPSGPIPSPPDTRSMSMEELDLFEIVHMITSRIRGDVATAMKYANRLLDRIEHGRDEVSKLVAGPLWFFHHQIGSTMLTAGDSSSALTELATSRQLGSFSRQPDAVRIAQGRIALAHALRGSLDEAEHALHSAQAHPLPTQAHVNSALTSERTAEALVGVERVSDDLEQLLGRLEPYDSVELSWPFALLARTRAAMLHQRPEDALEAIRLARGAHPIQHGTYAFDIVTAMSINAFIGLGNIARARSLAEEASHAGILTKLACVRVALIEENFTVARAQLHGIDGDASCGPAPRNERLLLDAWLELESTGTIDQATVWHVSRLAKNRDNRRLFGTMPRQLIDGVHARLKGSAADEFARETRTLPNFELHTRPALTPGEERVLSALPKFHTTAEIAAAFHVSPNTVKTQLRSLYRKLGCSTRDEALKIGTRLNLV